MSASDQPIATLQARMAAHKKSEVLVSADRRYQPVQFRTRHTLRDDIVPADWINDICSNGDENAWKTGEWGAAFSPISKNMRYRSGWYTIDDQPRLLFSVGIHG